MKLDIIKHSKKTLIASLSVLLIGILLFAIFNFNLGMELKGYTTLTFEFGIEISEDKDFKEMKKDVCEILKENDARIYSVSKESSGINTTMNIKIKNECKNNDANLERAEKLVEAVVENYPDMELYEDYSVSSAVLTNNNVAKLIYSILFALIVALLYFILRLRLLNSVIVILTTLANLLMLFAVFAITRAPLNLSVFGIVAVTTLLAMIITTLMLSNIKNNRIDISNAEIANKYIMKNSNICLILTLTVPMLILLIFGNVIVRSFALCSILAILVLVAVVMLLPIPLYHYLTNFTVEKVKPVKVVEASKEEAEEVEEEKIEETQKVEEKDEVLEETKEELPQEEKAEEEKIEEVKEEPTEEVEVEEEKKLQE